MTIKGYNNSFGPIMDNVRSVGEYYYDHFERYLGNISSREIFGQDNSSPAIQILEYHHKINGCMAHCSMGLYRYAEQVGGIYEVFVPTDAGWDLVPRVTANVLFYCVQNRMRLGRGVSIGGIENVCPGFVQSFSKTAMYFTLPYNLPRDFIMLDEFRGAVLLGIFISQQEKEFFLEKGVEAFERLLEEKGVDPFQLSRSSML